MVLHDVFFKCGKCKKGELDVDQDTIVLNKFGIYGSYTCPLCNYVCTQRLINFGGKEDV